MMKASQEALSAGFMSSSQYFLASHLACVLFSIVACQVLNLLAYLAKPMNYHLDMTGEEHCKKMAEIDNSFDSVRKKVSFQNNAITGLSNNSNHVVDDTAERSETIAKPINKSDNNSIESNVNQDNKTSSSTSDGHETNETKLVNGWIPVIESMKVPPGSVRNIILFGKDLVVTRSDDGNQVNVLDAYCPHAGVHIGIGGMVKRIDNESCVECPFHGWAFRSSDGQCVDIPYQRASQKKCIPAKARLGSYKCAEVDNFIYVWHHIDGAEPDWELDHTEPIRKGETVMIGRTYHKSNLDISYMHENGADMFHFDGIHNDFALFGGLESLKSIKYLQKYISHGWNPTWKPLVDEKTGKTTHMAQMSLTSHLTVLGNNMFYANVCATQIGPARVRLRLTSKWFGTIYVIMNSIPLGGRRTKYIQHFYCGSSLRERILAKVVLYGEVKMLERDLSIWNHKKTLKNPILVQEDRIAKQFKLWYSQFYRRKRKITIQSSTSVDQITANSNHNARSLDF